jgi:hypothetical protein
MKRIRGRLHGAFWMSSFMYDDKPFIAEACDIGVRRESHSYRKRHQQLWSGLKCYMSTLAVDNVRRNCLRGQGTRCLPTSADNCISQESLHFLLSNLIPLPNVRAFTMHIRSSSKLSRDPLLSSAAGGYLNTFTFHKW